MNPYILPNTPRYVIIDYRASDEILSYLKKLNIEPIKTIKCTGLQEPVDGHPDMVIHPVDYQTFIVAPNVYDYYRNVLADKGIKVIKGGKTLSRNYPEDIAYNVARIGRYAVHNTKHTDQVLKYYLEEAGIEFIHVNQGYSKCSTSAISDQKALTSDLVIHEKLKSYNIDCMYINPKVVHLQGYDHGFIGGCAGLINEKIFLLTGKIVDRNILNTLKNFIQSAGYIYDEASSGQIIDLGSLIPII
jgi:translation initiation factor 2 beta subunit (eIF-2beta)/eIF-5